MSERIEAATRELDWYFNDAEGEACGLRSGGWHVLEETDGSSGSSGGSGARHFMDPYPEHRASARRDLSRIHAAYAELPSPVQAVLAARFVRRSGREVIASTIGAHYTLLAQMLPEVRARMAPGESAHHAAQAFAKRRPEDLRRLCDELIAEALAAYIGSRWPQDQIREEAANGR